MCSENFMYECLVYCKLSDEYYNLVITFHFSEYFSYRDDKVTGLHELVYKSYR